jgi:hypothetical protein
MTRLLLHCGIAALLLLVSPALGGARSPDSNAAPSAAAVPALPQVPAARALGLPSGLPTMPALSRERVSVAPPPTPGSAVPLFAVGVASTYGPGWPADFVALPQGPGWRFRVCGQRDCLVLISTDTGPDQGVWPGRIVDLPVWAFERVSGQPWTRGLASVSVEILGREP